MDYLKVWTSFREAIAPLNDAEKGRLFDSMLLYAETGEEPSEFKGNERFLWAVAKQDIDRTAQKCETLRKNGAAGGRAKQSLANSSKEKQSEANSSKEEQMEANSSLNIKKSKEKKSNNKVNGEIRRFTPPTPEEVAEYCRERGNGINPERFIAFYASKGWKVGNQPMKDWKAAIITWEQRDKTTSTPINTKSRAAIQCQQRETPSTPESVSDMLRRMDEFEAMRAAR